jgi:hypothetical protein
VSPEHPPKCARDSGLEAMVDDSPVYTNER